MKDTCMYSLLEGGMNFFSRVLKFSVLFYQIINSLLKVKYYTNDKIQCVICEIYIHVLHQHLHDSGA